MSSPKHLFCPSPLRWLALVWVDWAFIITSFALAGHVNQLWAYWLASLVIGNRQHALSIMGHDAAHFGASRNKRFNNILGALLVFWPLGTSLRGYRKMHFAHHAHHGTEKDPEIRSKAELAPHFDYPFSKKRFALQLVGDLLALHPHIIANFAWTMRPTKLRDLTGVIVFGGMFWTICIVTQQYWILALWYASMLTSFLASFRLRMWTEHMGTTDTHRLIFSSWQQFLIAPHWAWAHYEHHRWPWIPSWNLPKARAFDDTTPIMTLRQLITYHEAYGKIADASTSPALGSVRQPESDTTQKAETRDVGQSAPAI